MLQACFSLDGIYQPGARHVSLEFVFEVSTDHRNSMNGTLVSL